MLGILEVSRSIGDFQYKAHGVICTPDLKKLTLTDDDWFVMRKMFEKYVLGLLSWLVTAYGKSFHRMKR